MNNYFSKYNKYKAKYLGKSQSGGNFICDKICKQYIELIETGNGINYRIYIGSKSGNIIHLISPFHGINLYPNYDTPNIVNMIIEIPQYTQKKIEISKDIDYNPLKYDIKNNEIRIVDYQAKGSKYKGYPFHYGALPMTWERNNLIDNRTGKYGDNDPIDAFDISSLSAYPGKIKQVKILGAFAMIDNEETDWKLICIDIEDNKSNEYNNYTDIPKDILESIDDFLTNYKKPTINTFAEKKLWNSSEAIDIVKDVHKHWFYLVNFKDNITKGTEEQKNAISKIKISVEKYINTK